MLGPTLETERLILRPPLEADFEGWAELLGNAESSGYIGGPLERSAAWRAMAAMTGSWWLRGHGMFSVVEKSSGRWIGRLGPWYPEGWPGTEVGWGLMKSAWGKGYATEGSRALIDMGFTTSDIARVVAETMVVHTASRRVMEKAGLRLVRTFHADWPVRVLGDEHGDVEYVVTREEWEAQRA